MSGYSETAAKAQVRKHYKRFRQIMLFLGICSVLMFVISIAIGRAGFTNPIILIRDLFRKTGDNKQMLKILMNIRIPRSLASYMVGACLSIAGLVYQTTFNNKLVSPDILGVSSGCCVGAGIAILLGMSAGMIRIMAFIFGFMAVSIAIFLPKLFRNHSALTLVLSGIIVGSFMDSILAIIKYIADHREKLADIVFWIMGSMAGIQMDEVLISAAINVLPFAVLLIMGWRINVVSLGMEEAQSLGINYRRDRLIIIACSTLLTANCVSISGNVGWVGLVIPHMARAFVGDDARLAIPATALSGGLFLMIMDILSRLVSVNEIPLSIITGFIGAIIYTIVLARKGRYLND